MTIPILEVIPGLLDVEEKERYLNRLLYPWEETVSVSSTRDVVGEDVPDVALTLVPLIESNKVVPIYLTDIFKDAVEGVVLSKIYYISNGADIRSALADEVGVGEYLVFNKSDRNEDANRPIYVDSGIVYAEDSWENMPPLLRMTEDGFVLNDKTIAEKFVDFAMAEVKGTMYFLGGHTRKKYFRKVVDTLNLAMRTIYKDRLNVEWILKQPAPVIENTLYNLIESYIEESES